MDFHPIGKVDRLRLTRTFDISNCPIFEEIIGNAIGAMTGMMFSNFFPDYWDFGDFMGLE